LPKKSTLRVPRREAIRENRTPAFIPTEDPPSPISLVTELSSLSQNLGETQRNQERIREIFQSLRDQALGVGRLKTLEIRTMVLIPLAVKICALTPPLSVEGFEVLVGLRLFEGNYQVKLAAKFAFDVLATHALPPVRERAGIYLEDNGFRVTRGAASLKNSIGQIEWLLQKAPDRISIEEMEELVREGEKTQFRKSQLHLVHLLERLATAAPAPVAALARETLLKIPFTSRYRYTQVYFLQWLSTQDLKLWGNRILEYANDLIENNREGPEVMREARDLQARFLRERENDT
jgi:hypothetical protein